MMPQRDQLVEAVFGRYRLQLKGYLSRLLRSPEDAEDLVQETFLKFHAVTDFQSLRSPKAYLFTTAYRLAVNMLHRRKVVIFENSGDDILSRIPSPDVDAEEAMVQNERMDRLIKAVDDLPPQCRQVFILRKIEHMSHKQISTHMGISVSTVQKHLTKALKICRQRLASYEDEPAPSRATPES